MVYFPRSQEEIQDTLLLSRITNDKNFILRVLPYSYDFSFSPRRNDKKFYTSCICTLNAWPTGCSVTKKRTYIFYSPILSVKTVVPLEIRTLSFRFLFASETTTDRERESNDRRWNEHGRSRFELEGRGEKDLEKRKQSERNNYKSTLERMSKQISRDEDEGK